MWFFKKKKNTKVVDGDYVLYVKGKLYISADQGIDIWSGGNINEDGIIVNINKGKASKKETL